MDHNVTHATFTLERSYPVPPARVLKKPVDLDRLLATVRSATRLPA